jgi:3',5'-cyclic-AMP phosphodiesterase
MKKAKSLAIILLGMALLLGACNLFRTFDPDARPEPISNAHHIVVLGDPHYPGTNPEMKNAVIASINDWPDVELVVILGDLTEKAGRASEYEVSGTYINKLKKPRALIVGNHDYIYEDELIGGAGLVLANASTRSAKLERFKSTFGMETLYYSMPMDGYLLIFLSTDHLKSRNFAEISSAQLTWFRAELAKNRSIPTIVFFHAPLQGTLASYDTPNFVAKPDDLIEHALSENPQVFLWVSGHVHITARNAEFQIGDKLFLGRVRDIPCADMNHWTIWTTSLYLYPDRVVVRAWNHRWGFWEDREDLTVMRPTLSEQ